MTNKLDTDDIQNVVYYLSMFIDIYLAMRAGNNKELKLVEELREKLFKLLVEVNKQETTNISISIINKNKFLDITKET